MGEKSPSEGGLTQENRDRQGEILLRLMQLSRNIDALNGKTIEEVFDTENEDSRRALIDRLSDDEYIGLLAGVNGILRGRNKEEWNMDGVGVTAAGQEVIGAHIFPRHADKRDILQKTWEATKRMNKEGRSLEDIGMLLGSLLVETHPFNDGNGRTSRLVYRLTKDGFDRKKLKAVLGEDGRDEVDMALIKVYIDRVFFENHTPDTLGIDGVLPDDELPYGKIVFPSGSDPEALESIINAGRNDEKLFQLTIYRFLYEHPSLSIDEITKEYGDRKILLVQELLNRLTVEDVNRLAEIYWSAKKEYTEGMIDIFENPDRPEYQIERSGQQLRMLDYFKQRIESKIVLL
jgi:hypothetical protein